MALGEKRTFKSNLEFLAGADSVTAVEAVVAKLQEGTEHVMLVQPDPEWSDG